MTAFGRTRALAIVPILVTAAWVGSAAAQEPIPSIALTGKASSRGALAIDAVRTALIGFAAERGLGFRDLTSTTQGPDSASRDALNRAIVDYSAFRYAEAVKGLEALEPELARTGARGLSRSQLADLFIFRAMSRTELGVVDGARDDLVRAATHFPGYQLDEARFRPSLRADFERARQSVAATGLAEVSFDLEAGCLVHLDAERLNVTTLLKVPAGNHYLRVDCAGYEPFATAIVIQAGAQQIKPPLVATLTARELALSNARGAAREPRGTLLWVHADVNDVGRFGIELVEIASGESRRVWSVRVDSAEQANAVPDVLTSLLDTEFRVATGPPIVIAPPTTVRWYQRKWVWLAIGAAAATAVILPFALRDDSTATGFDIGVEGLP